MNTAIISFGSLIVLFGGYMLFFVVGSRGASGFASWLTNNALVSLMAYLSLSGDDKKYLMIGIGVVVVGLSIYIIRSVPKWIKRKKKVAALLFGPTNSTIYMVLCVVKQYLDNAS